MEENKDKKPENPYAYQGKTFHYQNGGRTGSHIHEEVLHQGMTLRDYFAAKAMQSFLNSAINSTATWTHTDCTKFAYQVADEMLKQREL